MRKAILACALAVVGLFPISTRAQHIAPYHPPGAEGHHRNENRDAGGMTFGPASGRFIGGGVQSGPTFPSYWTYNRFSNAGFGGVNYYYGPLGGYTPYVTPYGYTTFGYPNFGPYYSYIPLAPVVRQQRPYWIGADPFDDPRVQQAQGNTGVNRQGGARQPPPVQPVQQNVRIFAKQTSPEALRKSIRYQSQGDEYFGKQKYLDAYGHYKQAVAATPTRPEARFRMAMALAATTNYSLAVDEIKRAMRIDPEWPIHGAALDELFGADNNLSKNAVLHKVAGWVREDVRDPNRLFLMGVLLHFNDSPDQSRTFFEAASALADNPEYAQAFLAAEAAQRDARPAEEPRPDPDLDTDPVLGPKLPVDNAPEAPRPRPLAMIEARGLVPSGSAVGDGG